jgi:hypothetical protein
LLSTFSRRPAGRHNTLYFACGKIVCQRGAPFGNPERHRSEKCSGNATLFKEKTPRSLSRRGVWSWRLRSRFEYAFLYFVFNARIKDARAWTNLRSSISIVNRVTPLSGDKDRRPPSYCKKRVP